jgi:hypothetical protein
MREACGIHVEEMSSAYKILIGKPEGNSPFGRPRRRRWESNIKTGLREIGCGGMD